MPDVTAELVHIGPLLEQCTLRHILEPPVSVTVPYRGLKENLRLKRFCCVNLFCDAPTGLKFNSYTGCNRRNGPDFGRVFLMLNYTEKPQNTYIQSSMVTEI